MSLLDSNSTLELMTRHETATTNLVSLDPEASPFKTVIDPVLRYRLKKALFQLIDNHDASLEGYVSSGQLSVESYKEYVELFARCLRETMETKEGVAYLLKSCGFQTNTEDVNTHPDWRWNRS
ncbi:MAG: hypothetical protein SH807_10605 [Blastochloris sp.]|jgi:hypothetical protein|nr:hypothetical protein [Blastochloris sp.]